MQSTATSEYVVCRGAFSILHTDKRSFSLPILSTFAIFVIFKSFVRPIYELLGIFQQIVRGNTSINKITRDIIKPDLT